MSPRKIKDLLADCRVVLENCNHDSCAERVAKALKKLLTDMKK